MLYSQSLLSNEINASKDENTSNKTKEKHNEKIADGIILELSTVDWISPLSRKYDYINRLHYDHFNRLHFGESEYIFTEDIGSSYSFTFEDVATGDKSDDTTVESDENMESIYNDVLYDTEPDYYTIFICKRIHENTIRFIIFPFSLFSIGNNTNNTQICRKQQF